MKFLLLSLLSFLVTQTAAMAESYFLILAKKGTGLERIEMDNFEDCEELGDQWSSVSGSHTYACLKSN